ncbi:MAG: hypothetical protein IJH25_13010 [Clostridia bacterium]|nr:hypothetical protein [Clostridia bacterium]MBQ6122668.1 hypothetical protein [Clostridia bacterium]MBQ6327218.1 hypothetical protein [Clostridia bacterium]
MPNTHNTKNYMAHGGNELVIGGKLTFLEGAEVENFPGGGGGGGSYTLPPATASTLGGVKVGTGLSVTAEGVLSADSITPAAAQADSTATTIAALKEDFNTLLAALRTAGLLAAAAASGETPAQDEGGGS